MTLTIAIPVLNEELVLRPSVQAIQVAVQALQDKYQTTIVIADNGSTDQTHNIAQNLVASSIKNQSPTAPTIKYLRLNQRGKGLAIRTAWNQYPADILMFMDADLSTDLAALPPLLNSLITHDVAVGSRWCTTSQVSRPINRNIFSTGYRLAAKWSLHLPINDLPCGFKAVKAATWQQVAPLIKNNSWFFDTELLFHAHRLGHQLTEIPVKWTDGGPYHRPTRGLPWNITREYLSELRRLHQFHH